MYPLLVTGMRLAHTPWFLASRNYLHHSPTALNCYLARREDKSEAESTTFQDFNYGSRFPYPGYVTTCIHSVRNRKRPQPHPVATESEIGY